MDKLIKLLVMYYKHSLFCSAGPGKTYCTWHSNQLPLRTCFFKMFRDPGGKTMELWALVQLWDVVTQHPKDKDFTKCWNQHLKTESWLDWNFFSPLYVTCLSVLEGDASIRAIKNDWEPAPKGGAWGKTHSKVFKINFPDYISNINDICLLRKFWK